MPYARSLRTHKSPVSKGEESRERVEGNAASRALGVVVRRVELGASGGEAAAGDGVREAHCGSGEHLSLCQRACAMHLDEYTAVLLLLSL